MHATPLSRAGSLKPFSPHGFLTADYLFRARVPANATWTGINPMTVRTTRGTRYPSMCRERTWSRVSVISVPLYLDKVFPDRDGRPHAHSQDGHD